MKKYLSYALIILFLISGSCNENNDDQTLDKAKLNLEFKHAFNSQPVLFDTLLYINAAGNLMLFSEIQYFISDITLYYHDGSSFTLSALKDIHYVDTDIPSTWLWEVSDSIPTGRCDSVIFTFGLDEQKNQSNIFVNPPESLMFWPEMLGGGYHYLKFNGKWLDQQQQLSPFNFHLGIGQIYDNQGNITGFVHNYFKVSFFTPDYFQINASDHIQITFIMNLDSWFYTPNTWDFNVWGGMIMQNQEAMHTVSENGHDVFSMTVEAITNK
jgi:hypothetical protein